MPALEDVRSLCKKLYEDEDASAREFAELLQILFSSTVLQSGETLRAKDNAGEGVVGARVDRQVLKLNNGHFLKFRMNYQIGKDLPLTVTEANFQYQLDENTFSNRFIFRYDFERKPSAPNHPTAHLQIKGNLREKVTEKDLEDIRFPVNRPSVESMLRLMLTDFDLTGNQENWAEILKESEDRFFDYLAKKRLAE